MTRVLPQLFGGPWMWLAAVGFVLGGSIPASGQFGRAQAFAPYYAIPTGPRVAAVTICDFNGDGRNDVAATTTAIGNGNTNENNLLIFLQNSQGQLQSPIRYNTLQRGESVVAADFNSDGKPDIAVGIRIGIRVYLQRTGDMFDLSTNFATYNSVRICTGDFNNDGRSDIVGIGSSTSTVDILTQTAEGTMVLAAQRAGTYDGTGPNDIEAGDLNGDGLTDIAIMASRHLAVLLQTNGMLGSNYVVPVPFPHSTGVGVGDVTGDDRSDVVVALWGNRPVSQIAVVPQTGTGTLTSMTTYAAYDLPTATVVADVDLDGYKDVILAHDSWSRVGVFFGPTFETEHLFPVPYSPFETHGLAVGDVNNDERPDIVLGASDSRLGNPEQGLILLTNRMTPPPLRVSRISMEPGGGVRIATTYRGGRNISVQVSETLTNWRTIGTMTLNTWIDTNAPGDRPRFYRLSGD